MKHPEKWRETIDPFNLSFKNFKLSKVVGYPHAGNDVFQVVGEYQKEEVEAFIKVKKQAGADIENEIKIIKKLNIDLAPKILDFDLNEQNYIVTL